tara:strand:+ start:2571 stop:2813 length:243 start_codon:yes stop_codon:yes gene_type:complete
MWEAKNDPEWDKWLEEWEKYKESKKTKFFRVLTSEEEKEFREWANKNYVVGDPIPKTWHPVVVDECMKILKKVVKGLRNG